MKLGRIGIKVWDLRFDARDELYLMIDKHYKKLPRNSDGTIKDEHPSYNDNDIDALRHSYVSAVYVLEFSENTAEFLGRLQEGLDPREEEIKSFNMDLWNNALGRQYGKKHKRGEDLFFALLKALKNGELIITPQDSRKYKGAKAIKRLPKSLVIKIQENITGANIEFFDVRNKIVMNKEEFITAIKVGNYPGYAIKKHVSGDYPYSTRDRFSFNNLG
ncbi:MAG: hypothetical protein JNM93_09245 [Bacteriovoracaceae bacterium]|nr:hypothetical protein [Bacteriovoracaceae bacterium]